MMSLSEIETASAALANQLQAGIPLQEALRRMAQLQKRYESQWVSMADAVASGRMLSAQIGELWPENLKAAVVAGEMSGYLPEVFRRVEETMALQLRIKAAMRKVAYPITLGLAGVGVFIFFMVKVLPALTKALGPGDKGIVFQLSEWMHGMWETHLGMISLTTLCVAGGIVAWIRKASADGSLTAWMTTWPYMGKGLRDLYFGLWAYYLSILDAAGGIQIRDKLLLSSEVMPDPLREGVMRMADEVVTRGLAHAADPARQAPDDPRRDWPFYIPTAFIIAQETGDLGKEMMRVAPSMIRDGFAKIDIATKVFSGVALAVSAFFIVSPLMAYYMQLGSLLKNAMNGGG